MNKTFKFIVMALVGWSVSSFSRASFFPSISWTANGAQPVTSTSTVMTSTYSVNVNLTNTSIPAAGVVSSTTLLGALTQGTTASASFDSMRRVMTTGCPYAVISTTWTVSIATGTADVIIISSAAAQTRNFIVGILCENTSATNTDLAFYQGFSSATPAFAKFLGVPANYVPVGRDLRCGDPWFWSQAGGQITVKPGASVTAIKCAIDYYNAP